MTISFRAALFDDNELKKFDVVRLLCNLFGDIEKTSGNPQPELSMFLPRF
jgi:hypothetical protein